MGAYWAKEREPDSKKLDARLGEYRGYLVFVHRFLAGLLCELMKLLEEQKAVVESDEVKKLTSALPEEAADAWRTLTDVAWAKDGAPSDLRTALLKVRNAISYHYYQPKSLGQGYQAHFEKNKAHPIIGRACWSPGRSLSQTRFHYADAAAEGAVAKLTDQPVTNWNDTLAGTFEKPGLAVHVNKGLRFLIELFIRARVARANQAPAV